MPLIGASHLALSTTRTHSYIKLFIKTNIYMRYNAPSATPYTSRATPYTSRQNMMRTLELATFGRGGPASTPPLRLVTPPRTCRHNAKLCITDCDLLAAHQRRGACSQPCHRCGHRQRHQADKPQPSHLAHFPEAGPRRPILGGGSLRVASVAVLATRTMMPTHHSLAGRSRPQEGPRCPKATAK
jgi:hypothetical protein